MADDDVRPQGDTGARLDALEARLETAQQDAALLEGHLARRERAAAAVEEAAAAVAAARSRLADETADVERLESWSLARVWAGLRGDREQRLSTEQDEERAAQYAVAVAEAHEQSARGELSVVDAAVAALGDVATRRTRALADLEAWLRASGGTVGAELADVAEAAGRRRAELVEIAEARRAADAAGSALAAAASELSGAEGWSTYDTFFGGDMISSMAKHNRLDRAADLIRRADAALAHLAVELGDLGERGVGEVGVQGMSRTLDIWFDNFFTDLQVGRHIADARGRVDAALRAVHQVASHLDQRRGFAEQDLSTLEARRESILVGSSAA